MSRVTYYVALPLSRNEESDLAHMNQCVEPLSFLLAEPHAILLYGDLFPGHESSPSLRCGAIDSEFHRIINDTRH
jgi:hypothetical protein